MEVTISRGEHFVLRLSEFHEERWLIKKINVLIRNSKAYSYKYH